MNKQLIGIAIALSLAVGAASFAFAQKGIAPLRPGESIPEKAQEKLKAIREETKAVKTKITEEIQEMRGTAAEKVAERRTILESKRAVLEQKAEERKAVLEEKRAAVKEQIEARKAELKTKQEERKSELKARLEKIKDERKKAAVERLDKKIGEINAKLTNHWLEVLKRFEDLLSKASSRADKAEAVGRDVSNVRALMEKAHSAIAASKEVLTLQLSKTYPFEITDESALGNAVSAARTALNNDLKAAKETVQTAHKAVVEVIKSLKAVPDVDRVEQEEVPEQEE